MKLDRFERVVELAGKYKADLEERLVALRGDSSAIESTMDVFSSICDWRYSRGVFYTPFYFFNELVGDSPGKVVKKKFPSPLDARYEGFECAGFLGGDLAITISSAKGAENSRLVASRIERDGKKVFVLTSCHYDFTSLAGRAPEVVSVSLIDGMLDGMEVCACASVRGDFWIQVFFYVEVGVVDCVYVYGTGFREPIRHQFYYDWRGLLKITVPSKNPDEESIVWKRKR